MIIFPYRLKEKQVILTVDTAAYSAGDAIGKSFKVADATSTKGGQSRLVKVVITDASEQMASINLILFNKNVAAATDNAIFVPTDTEIKTIIGIVRIKNTDYVDFSDNSVAVINLADVGGMYIKTANASDIWVQPVAVDAPTYVAATDVAMTFTFEQQ